MGNNFCCGPRKNDKNISEERKFKNVKIWVGLGEPSDEMEFDAVCKNYQYCL